MTEALPRSSAPAAPVLVYDGDCPMCAGVAEALVRRGVLPVEGVRAAASFPEPLASRLADAGVRNEMAVLDPATGEVRSGAEGLLWGLRGTRLGRLCRLLDRRPLRGPVTLLYRLVAYNRRLLAVPAPRALPCACEPDDRPALRRALVAAFLAVAAGTTAAFGALFLPEIGRTARFGPALGLLLVAGAGWALLLPALLAVPRGRREAWVAHLAATAAAGAAVLIPSVLLGLVARGPLARAAFALSISASFVLMLGMQRKRAAYLRLGRGFVAAWVAALFSGGGAAWCLLVR